MAITEKEVKELEDFFKTLNLPKSARLDEGSNIMDVPLFIESHLNVLRNNGDKPISEVFYLRLMRLKEIL